MINKNDLKDIIIYILVAGIFILGFFIIKPILSSIIYGLLLAYITYPVYKFLNNKIKNETISALIVCLGFFIIIIIIFFMIISSLFNQALEFYSLLKKEDIALTIVNSIPPSIIPKEIAGSFVNNLKSAISNLIFSFLDKLSNFITDIPILLLKLAILIIVFFFALRDGEKAINYVKLVSPLKKETEERFFGKFKEITNSILLGQIFVGILQGLAAGIGYFAFGIKGALLLTLISIFFSIIPMIGPSIIWAPVFIYLLISGKVNIAFIFLIYNLFFTSLIDNVARPLIASKRTQTNFAIMVIGMIGGFLTFNILGLIIGPLILAYILLIMEIYKKKELEESGKEN